MTAFPESSLSLSLNDQFIAASKKRAIIVGTLILVAYGVLVSTVTQSKVLVTIADIISGLAVIGIAVLMYPLFKAADKLVSKAYLALKYLEGLLMIVAGLAFSISPEIRVFIYENLQVYAFIVSAFLFYYLLYVGQFLPRFIIIWGAAGICALVLSTVLHAFGLTIPIVDYLVVLIIANEVFLASWLMVKGFAANKLK